MYVCMYVCMLKNGANKTTFDEAQYERENIYKMET